MPVSRVVHGPPGAILFLCVVLGGAIGGLLRWSLGETAPFTAGALSRAGISIFLINVLGSYALSLLPFALVPGTLPGRLGWARREYLAAFLGPGLLGGFTTLSAAALATRDLLFDGAILLSGAYALGTVVATVAAVGLGRASGRLLTRSRDGARTPQSEEGSSTA